MSITSPSLSVKKKSRVGCLVVVVAIIGVVALAVIFYLGSLSQRVEGRFKVGLTHYNKGAVLVKKSAAAASDLKLIANTKMRASAGRRILKSLKKADSELDLARSNFKRMRQLSMFNWEKETADLMAQSAAEAQKSDQEVGAIIQKSAKIVVILADVSDGAAKFQQAVSQSNTLIALSNSGRYAEVKSAAPPLAQVFADAKVKIAAADRLDSRANLAPYLDQIAKGEQLANELALLADAGLSRRLDEFNRLSAESNALINQVITTSQSKLATDPEGWIDDQMEQLISQARDHESKADKLKKKALDLWYRNT